ncbi:MAG: hypothetical protein OXR66_04330 [Candidatus Woesearchaeota archaeon]|nr:hypothetical protein [Candidatus Woesearchaeota archaeon]
MGKIRWDLIALMLIIGTLFIVRMSLSASVPTLNYDSYLLVRDVEHILETGRPLHDDALSVTGTKRIGSPIFSYIMALFVSFSPLMYKILPNLLIVLLLVPVFIIAKQLTKSKVAAILAALLAGTAPAVFSMYLNLPDALPFAALLFFTILAMVHDPDRYLTWIIWLTIFLTFLHPIAFILVLTLLVRVILLRLEGFGVDKRVNELFFFTLLLTLWFHILIYKEVLFREGIRVIWQNLPVKYAALQFQPVTWIGTLYALGVVTFFFGTLGAHHALFEKRVKNAFTIASAAIGIALLMLLQLIELQVGLFLLSILLAIMAAYGLRVTAKYIAKTKVAWIAYPVTLVVLFIFVFTAILPALVDAKASIRAPTQEDVEAFEQIRLPHDAVLLTTVREGAAVQYFSGKRTLTDNDFLLMKHGDELVKDIESVYTARFSTTIVNKAAKLGFSHILFSNDAEIEYNRGRIFVENPRCLTYEILPNDVRLYKVRCT